MSVVSTRSLKDGTTEILYEDGWILRITPEGVGIWFKNF